MGVRDVLPPVAAVAVVELMDRREKLVLATRKSKLALTQSNWVKKQIEAAWPGLSVELLHITTKGDKILDVPLAKVGGKGLFVKEIEDAILRGDADFAVHSLKDVPAELPGGLEVSVFPVREDVRDAFVSNNAPSLEALPVGARVGTSSLRRMAQLRSIRQDLQIESLRGNLDTRLSKLDQGLYDAVILAAAGMKRLGISDRITGLLPVDEMIPAVGQGALGLEFRSDDDGVGDILSAIHHQETACCVTAERGFLYRLQGGCQVPMGALATLEGEWLKITGFVAREDGSNMLRATVKGRHSEAENLGIELAEKLLSSGAGEILEEVYSNG